MKTAAFKIFEVQIVLEATVNVAQLRTWIAWPVG